MEGHLHLVASPDAVGGTFLSRQSFAAPIHISKPHREGAWLVLNLASPTPGLLAGDRVEVRVALERGAHLLLTAPSASRIHTMSEGHAELAQSFQIAAGACLDVWPEYLIPQAGARYRQRTRIELEAGATMLWTETIAPGRVARGEAFAFSELSLAVDVVHGAQHLVRERYRWEPARGMTALQRRFPAAYYASLLAVQAQPIAEQLDYAAIQALHQAETCWVGVTRLNAFAVAVKIIAADSPGLRSAVAAARLILQRWLGVSSPSLRRVTGSPVLVTE